MSSVRLDEKKRLKKEALYTAAFDLFSTKGLKDTSISDIANKASVAKGTFYLYFKDKFDLKDKLVADKAKKVLSDAIVESGLLEKKDSISIEDGVMMIVDKVLERMVREPNLLRFITKNLSWGVFREIMIEDEEGEELNFYGEYHKLLEDSGRHFRNPDLLLYMITELLSGCSYQVILQGTPVTLDELKPDMFQAIRDMISRQEVC